MNNHTATDPQIATRIQRATEQRDQYTIQRQGKEFLVVGAKAAYHTTTCRCDCPDYTRRQSACKHIFMVRDEVRIEHLLAAQPAPFVTTPPAGPVEFPMTPERTARYARMALDFPVD